MYKTLLLFSCLLNPLQRTRIKSVKWKKSKKLKKGKEWQRSGKGIRQSSNFQWSIDVPLAIFLWVYIGFVSEKIPLDTLSISFLITPKNLTNFLVSLYSYLNIVVRLCSPIFCNNITWNIWNFRWAMNLTKIREKIWHEIDEKN